MWIQASNRGQGSDLIVPVKAVPPLQARPGIQAGPGRAFHLIVSVEARGIYSRIYYTRVKHGRVFRVFIEVCCFELDVDEENDRITVRSEKEVQLMLRSVS